MTAPASATSDPGRLRALHATGLLDAPAGGPFDRLARLAARLLAAPVALVSLVDADRQVFAGCVGLPEPWATRRQTPLSHSFCRHVVESGRTLAVEDARDHPVLGGNPAVTELGVVAYLGVPLITPDGHPLGSLCAVDTAPRRWSAADAAALADLAASVMAEVALRADVGERTAALAAANDALRRDAAERGRAEEDARAAGDRFRAAFDRAGIGTALVAPDGRFLRVNPAFCRFLGYTADELTATDFRAVSHPGELAETEALVGELAAGRRSEYVQEKRYLHRDGSVRWGRLSSAAVPGPDGRPAYFVSQVQDVTERKAAEAALRASEGLLRGVYDHAPLGIALADPDGTLRDVNPAFARIVGYAPAELAGTDIAALVHPDDAAAQRRSVARLVSGAADEVHLEKRYVRKDGAVVWVRVGETVLPAADGQPAQVIRLVEDVSERRAAEDGARLRERAIQAIPQGVCITDPTRPDNPVVYVNRGFERITGYAAAEVVGRNCRFLQGPKTDPAKVAEVRAAVRDGRAVTVELVNHRKDGTPFWNALTVAPVRDEAGAVTHFVAAQTDTTALRTLEDQFRQAQKMEAVGHLAGGIAHDFNNLLTVINGYSEILLDRAAGDRGPSARMLHEVQAAGNRAADLTRQLLAFSRQTVLRPKVVEVNALVANLQRMLARLIGEDVRLAAELHPAAGRVRVDPGQLEQVLVNLCVNARDAMPAGGRLTVAADPVAVGEGGGGPAGVPPGRYVRLRVADTGTGMTDAVKARLFEPFFTTKEVGKGTGLGLATVFGIVTQSGGHVTVDSEVGRGTTFGVYLPEVAEVPETAAAAARPAVPRGRETVLLVEDDPPVRAFAAEALRGGGYTVLEAGGGDEAAAVCGRHPEPVDLLLTDVVMPGGGGRATAERVAAAKPAARVLYMSGYTDDAVVRAGVRSAEVAFLQKPFAASTLLHRVREVLDAPAHAASPAGGRTARRP